MQPTIWRTLYFIFGLILVGVSQVWADSPLPEATNLWVFKLPTFAHGSAPTLAPDGTIYQATFNGTLLALTPEGDLKWQFKTGREIKSTPAVAADGTLYFGCRDGKLYALNPDGKLKWTFVTPAWIDSSPAIAVDGTLYFGGWDHIFYALNPNGTLKWKFDAGSIIESSPAIAADGTIYFGAHNKKLYALTAHGQTRWTFPTQGAIISSPAIGVDGDIYFSSLDGNLYRLKADGSLKWSYHSGSTAESSPVLSDIGEICIGHNDKTMVINTNGQWHWHSGAATTVNISDLAVGDHFYFAAHWRSLQSITAQDDHLWRLDLAANVSCQLTLGPDGTIYATAEKELHAVHPPGRALPPAQSSWPMFHANAQHTGRVSSTETSSNSILAH